MEKRLVILATGVGSNFAAMVQAVKLGKISNAAIVGLISNNPQAGALKLADKFNVPTSVIDSKEFRPDGKFDRQAYEQKLLNILAPYKPDLIILAGYMLVLGQGILAAYPGKIINIHPSLLPSFRGLHAQRQAMEYGVKWTGCTVHFVTEELDGGPIIAQSVLKIEPNETEEELVERLKKVEHQTYIEAVAHLCEAPTKN